MSELDNMDQLPSESLIDQRFETCYYEDDLAKNKCDSVLISIFGKSLFEENIEFNLLESTMNCQVDSSIQQVAFGNTEHCVPNSFDLCYSLTEGDETIYSFRMVAGLDMQFEPVSTIVADQLGGYQKLLDSQFKINYSKAKKIAKTNGVDFEESSLELVKNDKGSYHWEAELELDQNSLSILHIDVMSGKTSIEVLTITYTVVVDPIF